MEFVVSLYLTGSRPAVADGGEDDDERGDAVVLPIATPAGPTIDLLRDVIGTPVLKSFRLGAQTVTSTLATFFFALSADIGDDDLPVVSRRSLADVC